MVLYGCGNNVSSTNSQKSSNTIGNKESSRNYEKYETKKITYDSNNIKINYPQITNLGDAKKEEKVNQIIKREALKVLEDYKDSISNLTLDMNYEIKYEGTDILSIEYLGLAMVKDSAYPVNVIYTTNIDLTSGKLVTLGEAVTINDALGTAFTGGKYIPYSSDLNLKSLGAEQEALMDLNLTESFNNNNTKFYFTKDSLVISVEVLHGFGDHLEKSISYKDLGNNLLIAPKDADKPTTGKETANIPEKPTSDNSNTETKSEEKVAVKKCRLFYFDAEKLVLVYTDKDVTVYDNALSTALTKELKVANGNGNFILLPKEVDVKSASLDKENGILTVNLSENFTNTIPLGTATESGIISAVLSTYAYNYGINKVALYFNGELYTGLRGELPDGYWNVDYTSATEMK